VQKRGIAVRRDILRDEACAVLRRYDELGAGSYWTIAAVEPAALPPLTHAVQIRRARPASRDRRNRSRGRGPGAIVRVVGRKQASACTADML
jgi:hypothetical protein